MRLSVVIPAYNEEGNIEQAVRSIHAKLAEESIAHELVVVDDNSSDGTGEILKRLSGEISELKAVRNEGRNGFGYAVRAGLDNYSGDAVAIMMADLSDLPEDLVRFYRELQEGYDCVFGTRWSKGGKAVDYPVVKRWVNRLANTIVRVMFRIKYNDCTNAFKMYRRETMEGLRPFMSPHFNLTLEIPLKAIVRGYSYSVIPNTWLNRQHGVSKLKIKEMGSRYFFILLYCLIEKYFSRGDFKKS